MRRLTTGKHQSHFKTQKSTKPSTTNMQKFLIAIIVMACLLCFVAAQDVESIKRQIISQYERLPGHSVHHPEEVAHVIDPSQIHVNY